MLSGATVVAVFFSSVSFKKVQLQKHSTKPFTAITYSVLTEPVKALVLMLFYRYILCLHARFESPEEL